VTTVFWLALAAGIYPYAIYPLLAYALSKLRPRPIVRSAGTPRVTVVISAYNEARHIEATVRDKLQQDYPAELLDVIVASDGSTDGTDEILRRLAAQDPRLSWVRQEPRQGKTAALNKLVEQARGSIVVFSDANSIYRRDTLRRLLEPFSDPAVGYVSGKMIYVDPDGSIVGDGCSAYMRYENWLRDQESLVGSIVGVDGGVDAVRKPLYRPMRADQLPDFVLPLTVVEQGYRVVYEPRALLEEHTLTTRAAEYRMRVRVAVRALWALWDKRALLNPVRFPLFSWQLFSHKVLRYVSCVPLLVAACLNWMLLSRAGIYQVMAAGQVCFALLVVATLVAPQRLGELAPARYCYYFFLLNWASAVAMYKFLRGQKQVLWQPRTG